MNPRDVVNSILVYHERELPDHVQEDLSAYDGERLAESARFVRSYPAELPVLADLLHQIQTPVQIIQGNRDTGVLPSNAQYLRDRLPNSKLDLLDANHFVWSDRADDYAALVLNWWNDGYKQPRPTRATSSRASALCTDTPLHPLVQDEARRWAATRRSRS